jgi:hypothetical protein
MANPVIPIDADHPNVLHALTRKRAQIAGEIEHTQQHLRRLILDLDNVEATIRIFDPTVDIAAIPNKPFPPRHAAFKGEVTRVVLTALRKATEPLTSRDIAMILMRERGLNADDKELSVIMVKRVCACLRVHRQKGLIRTAPIAGNLQGWEVAPR